MRLEDWIPIYDEILNDFGFSRAQDESSARLLRTLMVNADLLDDESIASLFWEKAVILGNADSLSEELEECELEGTVISAGSATRTVMDMGIVPDIMVTDLDGDIESQIEASDEGAVTFIHAHGDNADLIMRYAKEFRGRVVLTSQSRPEGILRNYGGFTDGDRAYCLARHFGVKDIKLMGFDFGNPSHKEGSDPGIKRRKLEWAKRIMSYDHDHYDQD